VLGGGEQHLRSLARALVAAGLPATVITRRSEPGWAAAEMLDGIRVLRVPPAGPARRGKYLMVPAALRAMRREAPRHDVIVVRGTRVLGLPCVVAARALGRPVVLQPEVNGELTGEVYTWGTRLDRPWPRRLVRTAIAARNLLLRDADAFVAMSRAIEREFLQAGVPVEKVAYLPHGVDTQRFRPASPEEKAELRAALGWPADAVIAVYTGRLLRGKGLETLVDAFVAVAKGEPRVRLVLVGSGSGQSLSVEDELRARVRDAGLVDRVFFAGRVDDVSVPLRAADVFVFPSLFEALGLSLIEAAACGLPCIGSRTGGIVDVIEDGRSGLLVAAGERAELSRALGLLLRDAERRTALGVRAREVARERFDLTDSVDRYHALFAEVWRRGAASVQRAATWSG
jgi:glycosyltransferase involved in cell wall biosynthesis